MKKVLIFAIISCAFPVVANAKPSDLDGWCSKAALPSSIVVCSDANLRELAMQRNRVFAEAKERLPSDQYQSLLDNQSQWIQSYSGRCGVSNDQPVPNPIPSSVVECFRREGVARVQFIRNYGQQFTAPTLALPALQTANRPTERSLEDAEQELHWLERTCPAGQQFVGGPCDANRLHTARDKVRDLRAAKADQETRGPRAPGIPVPNLKATERLVIVASRADLDDAVALAESYKRTFPETLIMKSENGNFGISIGPFDSSQKPHYIANLVGSKLIPSDSYASTGARFVSAVWPSPAEQRERERAVAEQRRRDDEAAAEKARREREVVEKQVAAEAEQRERERAVTEQRRRDDEAAAEKARREREVVEKQAAAERADREHRERLAAEQKRRDEEIAVENARREREAAERRASAERAKHESEERLEAERARERLRSQANAERGEQIATKLKEMGFELISPIDLELDWRDLRKSGKKIALRGIYARVEDVDGLALANKDRPLVRLYLETASRDARKTMLECRNADFLPAQCRMVIGGTVQSCTRNKGKLNEVEVPCLNTVEAFLLPEGWAFGQ